MLVELYRRFADDYPKFFKMDTLCRLGFIAAEILLKEPTANGQQQKANSQQLKANGQPLKANGQPLKANG